MNLTILQITEYLNEISVDYDYTGTADVIISGFCPLNRLDDNSITWIRNIEDIPLNQLNSLNNILLVSEKGKKFANAKFPILYVSNAHRTFFRIIEKFWTDDNPENREGCIENSAIVETKCIGDNVYIGHNTYVGPDVRIGNNVQILNIVAAGSLVNKNISGGGICRGACEVYMQYR